MNIKICINNNNKTQPVIFRVLIKIKTPIILQF